MPWQRVEEIAEYRLNTKKLDAWLKGKWGNYDYQIKVRLSLRALSYFQRSTDMVWHSLTEDSTHFGLWSLERWVSCNELAAFMADAAERLS